METDEAAALEAEAQARAARGSLLFHLALAEALAGDAVGGRLAPEDLGGWALDVGPDGYEVAALDRGEAPGVRLRVTFSAEGRPLVEDGRGAPASPRQVLLTRVREAAVTYGAELGGRWLALPVPPPRDAPAPRTVEAWLIRRPERRDDLPAGPHWRLEVDAGEMDVVDARLACASETLVPDAARAAPFMLVHEGDDLPSEAHVMQSLLHGVAFEVLTPRSGLRWRVDGERITRLPPNAQRRA